MLRKPEGVSSDPLMSAKWDELTAGRGFEQSDAPQLELLCRWYSILARCGADIDELDGQVFYTNKLGDAREMPQIGTMKKASAEIRALSKQLGIAGDARPRAKPEGANAKVLRLVRGNFKRDMAAAGG